MKTRTRSQEKILNLLKTLNRPISAQDLYIELRNGQHNIGLATVYRALEALKLEGVVRVRTLGNGESLYSLVQRDRHYLTCVNCDRSIPIEQCPVHQLEQQLQQSHHFKVYYHTLEFFGMCDLCQEEES
ncbi:MULTISPECIES: Fur family transcriptional regulator [unclassified Spirulina]|jgi:Fur family ferric uptake transcriptional regulator|uniref:Fur family transcriptional regulator n=1 Tax=unclassified Spirulina TaxID=2684457 RepID=UPI001951E008|nr:MULTISPECIES: Fur family transcriptional regulator [Spirulina]MEA5467405.1 Fur family transcriptional regulator [Spirulina sp. 06S082]